MPKAPRSNKAGFALIRSKGSHRIYFKDKVRVVIPFHARKTLHPKTIKEVMDAIAPEQDDETGEE